MTVHDIRHLTLVQAVMLRPRMFTVSGTLAELLAFFNGCLQPPTDNSTQDDGSVRSLIDWLSLECNAETAVFFPAAIYDAAVEKFGTEGNVISAIQVHVLDAEDIALMDEHNSES
ncbi:MAG: hypothetical protein AAF497_16160 [Planctomycetota bacterium]